MSSFALGRVYNPADEAVHAAHPLRRLLLGTSIARKRFLFANGIWLDQGDTPTCVAHAWTHWLEDGPIKHSGPAPCIDPFYLYDEAQKIDGISGPHDGTTTLAAAQTLKDLGLVGEFHFAANVDEIVQAILQYGPVCIGTDWYNDMFEPDAEGILHLGGGIAGGHETLLDGVDLDRELFRLKNSWIRSWSPLNGFAMLRIADMKRLLSDGGDAAIATEVGVELP